MIMWCWTTIRSSSKQRERTWHWGERWNWAPPFRQLWLQHNLENGAKRQYATSRRPTAAETYLVLGRSTDEHFGHLWDLFLFQQIYVRWPNCWSNDRQTAASPSSYISRRWKDGNVEYIVITIEFRNTKIPHLTRICVSTYRKKRHFWILMIPVHYFGKSTTFTLIGKKRTGARQIKSWNHHRCAVTFTSLIDLRTLCNKELIVNLITQNVLNNGTLYAHVYLTKHGYSPDPLSAKYRRTATIYHKRSMHNQLSSHY